MSSIKYLYKNLLINQIGRMDLNVVWQVTQGLRHDLGQLKPVSISAISLINISTLEERFQYLQSAFKCKKL